MSFGYFGQTLEYLDVFSILLLYRSQSWRFAYPFSFLSILHKNATNSLKSEINSIMCRFLHVLCADLARLMCRFEHVLCVDSCGFLATLAWLASLASQNCETLGPGHPPLEQQTPFSHIYIYIYIYERMAFAVPRAGALGLRFRNSSQRAKRAKRAQRETRMNLHIRRAQIYT